MGAARSCIVKRGSKAESQPAIRVSEIVPTAAISQQDEENTGTEKTYKNKKGCVKSPVHSVVSAVVARSGEDSDVGAIHEVPGRHETRSQVTTPSHAPWASQGLIASLQGPLSPRRALSG